MFSLKKLLEPLARQGVVALLVEEQVQVLHLGAVHPLVVDIGLHVQLPLQGVELGLPGLIAQPAHLREAQILRVQGKGRVGVIGIGVAPTTRQGGIVDREQLDKRLPRAQRPVDQIFQVEELARTETVIGTQ